MVDKWFRIDDPDTEEADPELDRSIQEALRKIKFKTHFREALKVSRTFGKALIVCGFSDAKTVGALKTPLRKGSELLQLAVYPKISMSEVGTPTKACEFSVDTKDEDENSIRYGEPLIYKIHRGSNNYIYVHWTRVCEVGDGVSELDKVWDDMTCGRNIRWGASQWMYRTGGGFPVIGFPEGTTASQLEDYYKSGAFANLMSRTAIFITQNSQMANDGMTFEFKGSAGHTLDPVPFFKSNIEQIAIATGYPQAKLIGAQAGAVTGSEVNQQEYYKAISRDQEEQEDVVRWFIDHLAQSKQVDLVKAAVDKNIDNYALRIFKNLAKRLKARDYRHKTAEQYVITWNSAFELSELDEAEVELKKAQANQAKLDYMTPDEVRAEENLDPLPDGEGEKLKGGGFGGEQFLVQTKQKMKPNEQNPNSNPSNTGSSSGH